MNRYKLTVIQGLSRGLTQGLIKKEFPLSLGKHVIGRDPQAQIYLPSEFISKHHATIHITPAQVTIEDMGSRNGTFVNGMMIQKTPLHPGDRISLRNIVLEFQRAEVAPKLHPKEKSVPLQTPQHQPSFFERSFGPLFEQVVEHVEWKYLTLLLVFLFVTIGFGALVPPLLNETKVKLQT